MEIEETPYAELPYSLPGFFSEKLGHRILKVMRLAMPSIIAITITFGYAMVNTSFAGLLGDPHALAGLGLSNVLINGLWFTTFNGFSGALQTMVSQAASTKDFAQCNNTLRAALVVLIALYIPLGLLLYNIDTIMGPSMLNADPHSVQYAVTYTRTVMVGFFFEAIYDLEKKYLLQFGNAMYPMLIQFVTLPLHFLMVSQTYNWAPNSLKGIAIATNISFFLNFVALHVYLAYFTK